MIHEATMAKRQQWLYLDGVCPCRGKPVITVFEKPDSPPPWPVPWPDFSSGERGKQVLASFCLSLGGGTAPTMA